MLCLMKTGDKVTVNMGRRGGIQSGTVVKVNADGSFVWKNACNFSRTAKASQATNAAPRDGVLDPYIQAWIDEPGE